MPNWLAGRALLGRFRGSLEMIVVMRAVAGRRTRNGPA